MIAFLTWLRDSGRVKRELSWEEYLGDPRKAGEGTRQPGTKILGKREEEGCLCSYIDKSGCELDLQ